MPDDIIIAGWQKSSFIDFPGTVSTVLFLNGCNLRCPYCHNPGIVLGQFELISFNDIRTHIIKREGIIEGAVLSGGEPTLYRGLKNMCEQLKGLGVRVKIDTNGLEPEIIAECNPDYLALDIKTSPEKYQCLKVSHPDYRARLRRAINIAKNMGDNAEVRITAVPGIICGDDIESLCAEMRGISKIYIQQFVPAKQMLDSAYASVKPYSLEELEKWCVKFLDAGIDCSVR